MKGSAILVIALGLFLLVAVQRGALPQIGAAWQAIVGPSKG